MRHYLFSPEHFYIIAFVAGSAIPFFPPVDTSPSAHAPALPTGFPTGYHQPTLFITFNPNTITAPY